MKVFLDTNILLDVLTGRRPHFAASARIWTLSEDGRIGGLVSALSFANIYYVVRKSDGRPRARTVLRSMRGIFLVTSCDAQIIGQAVDADWDDFEDAVQYWSAVHAGADCIASRNQDHFLPSSLPVLTPAEFLATHSFE
jgi:predicted nucleic acid-binding protein